MEYALGLRCYPLSSSPNGSNGYEDARGNTFGHRFNHATLCLTHVSTTYSVARPFRHGNCMLNNSFSMPSKNIEDGSDSKILRGVTRVSLVLSCILGLFNFSSKMNPKLKTAYAFPPILMAGGEVAFESFWRKTISGGSIDPNSDPTQGSFDAKKIHIADQKLNELKEEYKKSINSKREPYLLRELIELLIIQGNFEEARKYLDDQIHRQYPELVSYEKKINNLLQSYEDEEASYEKQKIADILLYKAIVHTMLKHKEAAKWWEAFAKTLTGNE